VVRDQQVKEELARAALDQMFAAQTPLVIVVVSDVRHSARRYGERGVHFFSVIDAAFVAMLILLAVVNEGWVPASWAHSTMRKCNKFWACRRTRTRLGSSL
jgi:hypothetical protein